MEEINQNLTKKERKELKRQEKMSDAVQATHRRVIRRISIWLVSIVIIIGSFYGLVKLAGNSSNQNSSGILTPAISDQDWSQGNKNAKTTLVEYSDYECPACAEFYPIIQRLIADNSDKLLFVYRNFPLQQHANANITAYAAQAAGKQDKFWEMHDILFTNQNQWAVLGDARNQMIQYAAQLGLNTDQFKKDLDSQAIKDKISADYQSGLDSGVNATPTFYLNGKQLPPPNSLDEFKTNITDAINNAS
jgi:protein-disulfide isomerase